MWEEIGHAPKVCNHAYLPLLYPRLVLFWFLRSRRQRQRRSTGTATWWHWFHVREWISFIQPELDQISSRQWNAVMYSPLFVKRARSGTKDNGKKDNTAEKAASPLSPVLSARKHCLWLDFLKAQRHHRTFKKFDSLQSHLIWTITETDCHFLSHQNDTRNSQVSLRQLSLLAGTGSSVVDLVRASLGP
jgi:hypothetical protein